MNGVFVLYLNGEGDYEDFAHKLRAEGYEFVSISVHDQPTRLDFIPTRNPSPNCQNLLDELWNE